MKKRILSLVLALLTVISLLPFQTLAEQAEACPYCDYTLAEDGTVVHSDYCNAKYAYDGSGDVGKYVRLIPEVAAEGVYVSADPEEDREGIPFYDYEFGENTIMQITDWYWDAGTTALWYRVELYSGAFPESTEDYSWPETPWIMQDYTDETYDWPAVLEFVTVEPPVGDACDICGQSGCTRIHFYCERCQAYDCGLSHLYCGLCEKYDCGVAHVWCGRCGVYDCGQTHEPLYPLVTEPVIPEAPALTEGADVSVADEYGNAVTDSFILSAGMKSSLSAWTDLEGDLSYQWQICVEGQWIDILGQTEQGILVSPAMFLNVAEDGRAVIRCEVTNGEEVLTSAEITVSVAEEADMAAFARGSGGASQTEGDTDLQKVSLIVEYKFTNNTVAANPWTAELTPGKPIKEKIKLPVIPGYLPTFVTTGEVELVEEDGTYYLQINYADGLSEDTLLTVTYQPTNVKVTVLHYWQNVDNDNYVLHETTTKQLLTGSAVGDVHETYPGFYNLLYEKPVVAADGSTEVEVYYDRYYYLMKFDLGGGYGVEPVYARYGANISDIGEPTRPGYTFLGWKLNGTGETIDPANMPKIVPAENRTYVAQWQAGTTTYDVVFWYENADDDNYAQAGVLRDINATAGTIVNGSSYANTNFEGRDSAHFTYSHADENVEVEGDGSTVVNVYFSRNVYDLTFVMGSTAGNCDVPIHSSHTDYTGDCYALVCDKAHIHDDSCGKTLTCGLTAHEHTDDCLQCGETEHTHGDADCECRLKEHTHDITCCTKEEHAAHTSVSCFTTQSPTLVSRDHSDRVNKIENPTAGTVYKYRVDGFWNTTYYNYFYDGSNWYYLGTGNVYSGIGGVNISKPNQDNSYNSDSKLTVICTKEIHTHGDGDCNTSADSCPGYEHAHGGAGCNCSIKEHTHDDSCYDHPAHAHTEDCYTYQCGAEQHTHVEACYKLTCDHLHYHNGNTCYLVITRKYDADISDVWKENPVKAIIDDGDAFTWDQTNQQVSFMEKMPGVDSTMTRYDYSGNRVYHWFYYLEVLPGTDTTGLTTRTDTDGKVYYEYDDSTIRTSSTLYLTYDDDYYPITGFDQRYEKGEGGWYRNNNSNSYRLNFTDDTKNSGEYRAYLYYTRNSYDLTFSNNGETVSGKGGTFLYEQDISGQYFEPAYPSTLEAGAYEFDGWYTSPYFGDTKFSFTTENGDGTVTKATMPAEDITLYANWVPVTHTVKFYLDKNQYEAGVTIPEQLGSAYERFNDLTVTHGYAIGEIDEPGVAADSDETHPYKGYKFEGWFYVDPETGDEKAFIIGESGLPVTQDLNLYAKWGSDVLRAYTIYFVLDEDGDGVRDDNENTYVADPITGSTLAGNSRTFDAKGDTDLYPAYRDGYYPNAVSHTITVSIDDLDNQGANTHTFLYTKEDPIPYTVKYRIEGTDEQVPGTTDKTVADNTKAVVTENFVPVSGYMPDAYQKTLVITPNGDNTMIFWYTKDEQHALYQINHYIQNVDGATWTLYDSETITGEIGIAYSASPTTITGFSFNAGTTDYYNVTQEKNGYTGEVLPGDVGAYAGGKVTGKLTSNGMQLNLYYTRNVYPYQIYFLEYGSNRELKNTINGSAAYGALVSHTAESVFTKTDEGIEFELYDTEPETKTMTIKVDELTGGTVTYNKIVFYYKRCTQDLTISKVVTGEGANPDQAFSFTVTIDPKYSFHQDSYAYGEGKYLSPVDGVLSFSLKNGESITLQDLPTAEYTITEVNLPLGYYADMNATTPGEQPFVDVVLKKDANVAVTCTNTYDPAVLEITKKVDVVEENGNIPEVSDFKFHVTVPDGVTGTFTYTVAGVAHTQPVEDGKLTFTLKNGQTARFENVPVGPYTVEEEDYSARGYKSSFVVNDEQKGEGHSVGVQVARGETRTVECINHFPVGHLQIKKTVTKEFFGTEWDGDTFTFTVERTTADRPLIDGNQYDVYEGETKVDTAIVEDGKLQVTITFNKTDAAKLDDKSEKDAAVIRTIEIRNLPAGTYEVTENADADYVQTPVDRVVDGLEIPAEMDPVAQFANELIRPKGDLSLSKELVAADGYTGELPQDTEFSFTFEAMLEKPQDGTYTVEYKDKNGNDVPSMPTTVEMKDGKFTLRIQKGQTVTIKNLPIDTYRITEATVPRMANAFYHNGSETPQPVTKDSEGNLYTEIPVEKGKKSEVKCVNTYPVDHADLIIDHNGAEENQIFVYEVQNTDTKDIITVTVTGNGTTVIHDLPFGEYTVTQKNDWSWRYEDKDVVQTVNHQAADTTVEFGGTWLDKWLGGCSALFKNIFGG